MMYLMPKLWETL